jgi:hypothetical protein
MPADYLFYWKPEQAKLDWGKPLIHAASNQYGSVRPGDTVWIVTARPGGRLVLLNRLRVHEGPLSQRQAARRLGERPDDLYEAKYHILSDEADMEPVREVELADIAASLRFESTRDRLDVSGGRIKAQQLQRMRRLTPESTALLRARWGSVGAIPDSAVTAKPASSAGAGFGDAEANREVERAAVAHVTMLLIKEGWIVTSKERDKIGYDLLSVRGNDERHVEVKGVRGSVPDFLITCRERDLARSDPMFSLFVVTNALDSPAVRSIPGIELEKRYRFEAWQYHAVALD